MRSSVAIVGAGAIGCWLADALDRAGWAVSMLARGATLAALRSDGLIVERGGETRHSRPRAGSALELGNHDYVFLTVKAQALPDLAPSLSPLIGPSSVVISGTNGMPWWFFHDFGGILANQTLRFRRPGPIAGSGLSAATNFGFGGACVGPNPCARARAGGGRGADAARRARRRGLPAGSRSW